MDRLERLVNLVAALLDAERPLSREEVRARVGGYAEDAAAFRRTFERDKETLRQIGLPLVTEPLDPERSDEQVGYRIPRERYELPDPGLTEEELAALRIAAGAVRLEGAGLDAPAAALRKLGAAPASDPDLAGTAELAGGAVVATAFGAVAERRRVRFRYRGADRLVDPWRLSFRSGSWYLAGWDHTRGGERRYRLDRVDGPLTAEDPAGAFPPPPPGSGGPPPPWQLGEEPPVEALVLVDADQAPWAVASAGEGSVARRHPDGGVELHLTVTNREALRSWVLGFLDHAEILGPPPLRAELRDWLADLAGGGR